MVAAQWHHAPARSHHLRDDRVGLERAPGEDHLIGRSAGGLHQLLAQRHRSRTDGELARWHVQARSEAVQQRGGTVTRIPVDTRGGITDRCDDVGQRRCGDLVTGQLHRTRDAAARDVARQLVEVGSDHATHRRIPDLSARAAWNRTPGRPRTGWFLEGMGGEAGMMHAHPMFTRRRVSGAMTQRILEQIPLSDGCGCPISVAAPESTVRGGIVVEPDIRGVTDAVWQLAAGLASEGWLAVIPHLYHRDGVDELPEASAAVRWYVQRLT